jgi:hypothetical protein
MTIEPIIIIIAAVISAVYTVSYGVWNWKEKNKIGSVAVILLSVASSSIAVIYTLYGLMQ